MLASFQLYGIGHISTLATITLLAIAVISLCRRHPHSAISTSCLCILAFLCLASYPINQLALQIIGDKHRLDAIYPFHLCDIVGFICGFALITRKPSLCELSYFWGLAGTVQGLLTPNLSVAFPNPQYIAFFILHGAIVITALLLPLGLGWRPRPKAAWRAFLWVLVYAVFAGLMNLILDTNFAYLAHKPSGASLLDMMGPWPWYIICLIVSSAILFFLLSLPFKKQKT